MRKDPEMRAWMERLGDDSYVPAWMGPRVAVGGRIYPLLNTYLIRGIKKKKTF